LYYVNKQCIRQDVLVSQNTVTLAIQTMHFINSTYKVNVQKTQGYLTTVFKMILESFWQFKLYLINTTDI